MSVRAKGFSYVVSREQLEDYGRWPVARRLKWLFLANRLRRFLPGRSIEFQEAFRKGRL
jgi:hypothetical protein